MDITVYQKIYEALELALDKYNAESSYRVALSHYPTNEQEYPLVIFEEVRNQPQGRYYGTRERISSLGYKAEIYAQTKVVLDENDELDMRYNKQSIAREIMQFVVDFMQERIGLEQISKNEFPNVGVNGELYQITLVFQQSYLENKEFMY